MFLSVKSESCKSGNERACWRREIKSVHSLTGALLRSKGFLYRVRLIPSAANTAGHIVEQVEALLGPSTDALPKDHQGGRAFVGRYKPGSESCASMPRCFSEPMMASSRVSNDIVGVECS